jgi:hypothetical protein
LGIKSLLSLCPISETGFAAEKTNEDLDGLLAVHLILRLLLLVAFFLCL